MKTQYSAAELAGLRLDGLPTSEKGIRQRVDRDNWAYVEDPGKGGKNGKRREYPLNQPALKHLIPIILDREATGILANFEISTTASAGSDISGEKSGSKAQKAIPSGCRDGSIPRPGKEGQPAANAALGRSGDEAPRAHIEHAALRGGVGPLELGGELSTDCGGVPVAGHAAQTAAAAGTDRPGADEGTQGPPHACADGRGHAVRPVPDPNAERSGIRPLHVQGGGLRKNGGSQVAHRSDDAGARGSNRQNSSQLVSGPGATTAGQRAAATAKDRETEDRRIAIKRALQALVDSGYTPRGAADELKKRAKAGLLTPALTNLLREGRDARGNRSGDGWISVSTLGRIYTSKNLLPAPSSQPDQAVLPWHPLAIALLARPQKPTKKWVAEQIAEMWHPGLGAKPPTEDQVYYFFARKFSKGDQHDGRHTGSDLRSKKFYQHRTAQGLPPFTEVHADGWTTHFTAPHPITGEFVTFELWHFQCIATKYVTPMAIAMSECMEVIAKGIENCIRVGGVPAFLQTDSTGSMKNQTMEFDPITSLSARSGMTVVHPVTVGNSQANGIAENFNTFLDRESKPLASYQGKSMDSLVFKRQGKLTKKMVAARSAGDLALAGQIKAQLERVTKGLVFETYADVLAWKLKTELKWNSKPHRALPLIHDPVLCKKRHMTPQESLDSARAAGWEPAAMDEASLVDLFRVHETRKVTRETVIAYNKQRYYHADLNAYDGEMVMVAIDRMEWQHVWVKDMQGRLLCKAKYVAATGYRALTMYEAALERRAEAQLKRLDEKAEAVQRRMAAPPLELEAPATVLDLSALAPERQASAEPVRRLDSIDTFIRIEEIRNERLAREAAAAAAAAAEAGQEPGPEKKVAAG